MFEYHVKLKGHKTPIVLNAEQWKVLRQKDEAGKWFIPREDRIVAATNGVEFNLRNYDGVTPVFIEERPAFFQEADVLHEMTPEQQKRADKFIKQARMLFKLKTVGRRDLLPADERKRLDDLEEELAFAQSFGATVEEQAEKPLRKEFRKEFWDVHFDSEEAREKSFQKWHKGRNNYTDPRMYNRYDFVVRDPLPQPEAIA